MSPNIYVVCLGYKGPAKFDPLLLDQGTDVPLGKKRRLSSCSSSKKRKDWLAAEEDVKVCSESRTMEEVARKRAKRKKAFVGSMKWARLKMISQAARRHAKMVEAYREHFINKMCAIVDKAVLSINDPTSTSFHQE